MSRGLGASIDIPTALRTAMDVTWKINPGVIVRRWEQACNVSYKIVSRLPKNSGFTAVLAKPPRRLKRAKSGSKGTELLALTRAACKPTAGAHSDDSDSSSSEVRW